MASVLTAWRRHGAHLLGAPLALLIVFFAATASAQDAPSAAWELKVCESKENLPYSSEATPGFENLIAEIMADELGADLTYVWLPRAYNPRLEDALIVEGTCDLFMGVADGQEPFLSTLPYYQSMYVFVTRSEGGPAVTSLDDAALTTLRVGVMKGSLPDYALAKRGIIDNVRHFLPSQEPGAIDAAVAAGELDVGIAWGPVAAYFAPAQPVPLRLEPVTPQIDMPYLPMLVTVTMGVREDDVALRDLLNRALATRWDDVQAVLDAFRVPLIPLPRPAAATGGV